MPGFDGTGPGGKGPMTGRGRGFCKPNSSSGPFSTEEPITKSEVQSLREQVEQLKMAIDKLEKK
jgi:hypothetical protein